MGKYIDAKAMGESPETAVPYRQFAPDFASSSEQPRWKLLDSIAKHAPEKMKKTIERAEQPPVQPSRAQVVNKTLPFGGTSHHEQSDFKMSRDNKNKDSSQVRPNKHSFGSLFEAYSDNNEEKSRSDNQSSPLKALLRQVNS